VIIVLVALATLKAPGGQTNEID